MAPFVSTSALDRVLFIPEIWIMVFEHFDEEDDPDYATLASCSQVSHSWNILAERPLWRHLPSVTPLFKLLGRMRSKSDYYGRIARAAPSNPDRFDKDDGPWVGVYT